MATEPQPVGAGEAGCPLTVWEHVERLAHERPDDDALIAPRPDGDRRLSFRTFRDECERIARGLRAAGVQVGDRLVAALPNGAEIVLAAYATWRCGATFIPLSPRLPAVERDRLLELAEPRLVLDDPGEVPALDGPALPPATPPREYLAIASGGSTGKPKLIVNTAPLAWPAPGPRNLRVAGLRPGQRQLVLGPLYHNGPFAFGVWALSMGHTLVVPPRFEAAAMLDAFDRYSIAFAFAVPTHLLRMHRALLQGGAARFDSLETLMHSGAACPAWLKRWWIDRIGPERVMEVYGATEGTGMTAVRGDDWLARPGTVGRPCGYELRIVGEDGAECAPGEVGEVFLAPAERGETYRYLGAPPLRATEDGLQSVGDLGWVDEEGWLFISDRRTDLIISGGSNVYPAEVEAALVEHPEVVDAAVVGLPDPEWGRRVHAIIQVAPNADTPAAEALDAWTRERLAAYKAPRSYEVVSEPLRSETGKLTRSRLLAERVEAAS